MKPIIYTPVWGEDINKSISTSINLSKYNDASVQFEFNGISFSVDAKASESICYWKSEWSKLTDRNTKKVQ